MSNLKLVIIGAGSSYTPELIEGVIINHKHLPVSNITLVDVELGRAKLDIIHALATRMISKAGLDISITKTMDRRSALTDADFVVTQLRVGGIDARIRDEKLPMEIGFIGQETNGAGGMLKALRTIPVIIDIANEMNELCPDAWLVNFTNPASMVTEAVHKYSNNKKVIGLCNGPINMKYKVAELLNVEPDSLFIEFQGSNHMNFITSIQSNGVERLKEVIGLVNSGDEDALGFKNVNNEQFNKRLMTATNFIPSSYLKYYLKKNEMIAEQEENELTRGEQVKKIEKELFVKYADPNLAEKPKELEQRGGALYSTAAINVIKSLYLDDKSVQAINVVNNGAITNLPYDCVVEVNCVITKKGPIPLCTGDIPSPAKGIVSLMKDYEKLVVKAAATGDYEALVSGFTYNPLCFSDNSGVELLNRMLVENKEYLPTFSSFSKSF